ncbi:MAG: hypothetical protein ACI8SK_001640, partial [Shewanella sp.]
PYELIQRRSRQPKTPLQASFSGSDAVLTSLTVE